MRLDQSTLMAFLREATGMDDVQPETPLFSAGLLDSVSMVSLIAFIEQGSGMVIRPEDVSLENFDTADRILRFSTAATV